jgi:hypothetical protein
LAGSISREVDEAVDLDPIQIALEVVHFLPPLFEHLNPFPKVIIWSSRTHLRLNTRRHCVLRVFLLS